MVQFAGSRPGRGAKFLLIWQPTWWAERGQIALTVKKKEDEDIVIGRFFALRHNFTVINDALVARLKNKPYFIDFQNILCPRTEPVYQDDGIHLEDVGRKMVAQRMSGLLKARFFTSQRSPQGNDNPIP